MNKDKLFIINNSSVENVSLKAFLIDTPLIIIGIKNLRKKYAVPVSYWIPLISKGTIYTGIGIHDSNNKDLGFQNINAWQTFLGSNGCINTPPGNMPTVWQYTTVGMAVIVRGDLYINSPGEYDKPVEFGKLIQ